MGPAAHPPGVMSRFSRFDRLEGERPAEAPDTSGASLDRFSAEESVHAPDAQVDPMRPPEAAQPLARFEADGAHGVGLELGEERSLPFKRCAACGRDCSKFSTECHGCHASLESPEALSLNAELAAALKAEREASEQEGHERMYDRLRQGTQEQDALAAHLEEQRLSHDRVSLGRLVWWGSGVVVLGLTLALPFGWWSVGGVIYAGLVGLTALSPGALDALTRPIDRR